MSKINVTGVDLAKFIKEAYDLSVPQGLGHLHYQHGPLDDISVKEILDHGTENIPVSMDYVKGRAVKMGIFKDQKGELYIRDTWFDHTEENLKTLLERVGISHG